MLYSKIEDSDRARKCDRYEEEYSKGSSLFRRTDRKSETNFMKVFGAEIKYEYCCVLGHGSRWLLDGY